MGEIIAFASLKGGTGKSVLSANIGIELANSGKKVLLVDGCFGIGTIDLITGSDNVFTYNYTDAINGECTKDDILLRHEKHENLDIMFAPRTVSAVDREKIKEFFTETAFDYDYVIMDTPVCDEEVFKSIAGFADKAIIVTTPDIVSAKLCEKTAIFTENAKISENFIIINKFSIDLNEKYGMIDIDEIINTIGGTLIGIVPFDMDCIIYSGKGSIIENSDNLFKKACNNIARRITGERK